MKEITFIKIIISVAFFICIALILQSCSRFSPKEIDQIERQAQENAINFGFLLLKSAAEDK